MWTPGVQGPEAQSWPTVMGRAQCAIDQVQGQGEPQMAPGAFHQSLSVTVGQSCVPQCHPRGGDSDIFPGVLSIECDGARCSAERMVANAKGHTVVSRIQCAQVGEAEMGAE